ncbi:Tex family protein [Levilactobacillus bambusae]|uniref:RNA-binding transcriptional accessory protein n=1 Tax=Levilactobacillus bambusae TaxID=2024736 RepID=A0A2V1MYV8_9LACO|nr:Tex family protein [Levilactobacillus bambusae]PWF99354.1 RNA-binding transcriptional accessory protein [Levilactobacillus bambusae]
MEKHMVQSVNRSLPAYQERQISAVLQLLEDGNTVPFIARYRKERTGSLDEVAIREIEDEATRLTKLEKRKAEVLKAITEQGKLTPTLTKQLQQAEVIQAVEDLYLPYKQKRRTKATIAEEAGLLPFANWLLKFPKSDLNTEAARFLNPEKDITTIEDVFAGAHEILAEQIGKVATFRDWIRQYTTKQGQLVAKVKRGGEEKDEQGVYEMYYSFTQAVKQIPSYRILAINRGEKAGILSVTIDIDPASIIQYGHFRLIGHKTGPAVPLIEAAYEDAYKRFIGPAIERDLRHELTDQADEHAITVFGENLFHLLMQAPMKGQVVMGFDPAYRTGCKLAIMDQNGKFMTKMVIYPHKPASQAKRAAAPEQLKKLIEDYHVQTIAIGNGTASRESEQFVADVIATIDRPVYYVIVNESGASVYSASQVARDEFPDFNTEERSAVSIGRRLQDPLTELIKIDPKSVGVGQYQHDVPEKELDARLDRVVETVVNQVGVNVNTASPELLTHISGLTKSTARNIVGYRNEHGSYLDRAALKSVPRLGPKAYEQSVGFLRILNGDEVLDNTDIHPESYGVARQVLAVVNEDETAVGSTKLAARLDQLPIQQTAEQLHVGEATLKDIIDGLSRPGRDVRDTMPAPLLRQDVLTMADLKPGMMLQGTVRNVVDFGAFVDIGVKQDGLVHISQLTDHFISDPASVVAIGDIVTVWVQSVDEDRHRIQLSMVEPK